MHLPIHTFFRTLAWERTDRAIAIVLSGTGTDGRLGLLDIHDLGGVVLVQSTESAEFEAVDRHWKIHRKVTEHRLPEEVRAPISLGDARASRRGPVPDARLTRAYDLPLSRFVPTGVLVNERREALHFLGEADRSLRSIPGRVSHAVVNMARGDLRIALSSGLLSCLKRTE